MVSAVLGDIDQKVKAQQFDAAIGSIVSMAAMPKTDAQQEVYMKQVKVTSDALNERARNGDAAAQQAVNMMGRMMMGR